MSSRRARHNAPLRDDVGAVAGWEALPFGLLLFVVGALVVANAWGVVDAKMAASAGARAGARAFVTAGDAAGAAAGARAAVLETVAGHGRPPGDTEVGISGAFERCARITVSVTIRVPAVGLPWVEGLGPGLRARSTHAAIVDPLRSGVPGEASCVAG